MTPRGLTGVPEERAVPPWVIIAIVGSAGLIASLHFTLVLPLLTELPRILSISSANGSWLITVTLVTAAVSTPIVGRMADMYGKRRMLIVTLVVMTAGSVTCALTDSFPVVLAGRAMHGFASSLIAVGISILRDELPRERVGGAVALMSATVGIGSSLGLPVTGVLYDHLGWPSVFWLSGVAGALLTAAVALLVPESTVRTPGRFDVLGALLFAVVLTGILLPISKGASWGWLSPEVLVLLGLSAVTLAVWVPLELRTNQPMVDLRTAARRPVLATNVATLFVGFSMFVNMVLTIQQLQLPTATGHGFGMAATASGLAMMPPALAMAMVSPLCGRMLNRWGGRTTLLVGAAVIAVGNLLRALFSDTVAQVVLGATVAGVGIAIAYAAMPILIMASVPITETASANGLNSLVRSIGNAAASAVTAMVLSAVVVTVAGVDQPAPEAIKIVLWLAVAAALLGVAVAALIPAPTAVGAPAPDKSKWETVVRGRIVLGAGTSSRPALVQVLTLDGTPVDWSRADRDGRYSVALPGAGAYLVVANAEGWVPTAEVVEFSGEPDERFITLRDELAVSGTVSRHGRGCARALVAVSRVEGDHVGSVRCDDDGRYRLPMPPPGRYVLTALEPATRVAASRKVELAVQSATVDFDLTR